METFSDMVEAARQAKGWGVGKLAAHVGVLSDGRTFDGKQISLICQGKRSTYDPVLVQRLIDVLELPPAEAWHAAGVLPPATPLDAIRELLDARIKSVAAGDSAFAERQRRRRTQGRRSGGTPPPAAGPSKPPSGWSAAIPGQRPRYLTVVRERRAA